MSYILDALKRSDRERREGTVPELDSVHVAPVLSEHSRWSNSSLVLLVVLLGNIVFAGLWIYESMVKGDKPPETVAGVPEVSLPLEQNAQMPLPPPVDPRFAQPLAKPAPTGPEAYAAREQSESADTSAVTQALADYLAKQGTGRRAPKSPAVVVDSVADVAKASKPRAVARTLADLDPGEDPYASLFESTKPKRAVRKESAVKKTEDLSAVALKASDAEPTVITPSVPTSTASRGADALVQLETEPLGQGEEIIRPRSGVAPAAPPAAKVAPATPDEPPSPVANQPGRSPLVSGPVTWESVPLLEALPEVVRAELPPLEFNSHMYSSDPRFRTVIINGKSLREQDYLDPRTRLMKITEAGVVLQFDEVRFKVAVLEEWEE
jgi:hypothetical protein